MAGAPRAAPAVGLRLARPGRVLGAARSRLARPGIDAATVGEILARYGLRSSGRVENLPVGWRNRSVVVRTDGGRMVLKRYRDGWETPAIVHEHSILRHLASVGFPAVRVHDTRAGDTVVDLTGGRFALFGFEEGANLAGYLLPAGRRLGLAGLAGRLLARLHRDVEGFTPSGRHHLGFEGLAGGRARDLAWHLDALETLAAEDPPEEGSEARVAWRLLRERRQSIADGIVGSHERLEEVPLSRLAIHGDYGIHNLLVRRDGTATVHDFELSRLEWRLVDLVIALSRLGPDEGEAFLSGYDEVHGDRPDEWRLLPEVWQHYRLCGAVQSWHTYARLGGQQRLLTASRRIEEAERIAAGDVPAWVGAPR